MDTVGRSLRALNKHFVCSMQSLLVFHRQEINIIRQECYATNDIWKDMKTCGFVVNLLRVSTGNERDHTLATTR